VVGEVRGAEVVDLLAAMNTGHEGGCGTIHANSAADVPARIEALAGAAGLDRTAAHSQVCAALDVIVHLVREGGRRRVGEVHVVDRSDAGLAVTVPAVTFDADGRVVAGPGAGRLHAVLSRSVVPVVPVSPVVSVSPVVPVASDALGTLRADLPTAAGAHRSLPACADHRGTTGVDEWSRRGSHGSPDRHGESQIGALSAPWPGDARPDDSGLDLAELGDAVSDVRPTGRAAC